MLRNFQYARSSSNNDEGRLIERLINKMEEFRQEAVIRAGKRTNSNVGNNHLNLYKQRLNAIKKEYKIMGEYRTFKSLIIKATEEALKSINNNNTIINGTKMVEDEFKKYENNRAILKRTQTKSYNLRSNTIKKQSPSLLRRLFTW